MNFTLTTVIKEAAKKIGKKDTHKKNNIQNQYLGF